MKQILCIAIWLTGLLLAASCTPQHNLNALLMQADSLMEEQPDSALRILESINPEQLHTQPNRAFYALLLTQARDKNYIVQTDDSLIQTAVQYYDSIGDALLQAKAYYYKGSVYRDANQSGKAIKEYLTAIRFAEKANDKKLLGLIYNNAGYLYYLQDLLEQANAIYQQTEELAKQQNDTSLWAEALSFQGRIFIEKDKDYTKAEQLLQNALKIANAPAYKLVQADIAASLSSLYNRIDKTEDAILYAKLNISLRDDTTRRHRAYLLLGDAYFKAGQYDSATVYINKSLSSKSYGTKASAYMRLADIANQQGEISEALIFQQKNALYIDSLRLNRQSNDIINVEKKFERQQFKSILRDNEHKLLTSIIASCIIIVSIVILLTRYRQKVNSLKQSQSQLEQKQQEAQTKVLTYSDELKRKDALLAEMKEKMARIDADEKQWQQLQQEIEIMQKQRNAYAKEAFEHSSVFAKIERIIDAFKQCDKSDEQLNEEDWKCIIAEIDSCWNGNISRLSAQYKLSKDDIHLCCLFLIDIPVSHIPYLINCTRNTVYRKEREIINKMGIRDNSVKLKDILKKE